MTGRAVGGDLSVRLGERVMHYCLSDDYPGGKIGCTCSRGEDHPESLYDVPVSETEETSVATEDAIG